MGEILQNIDLGKDFFFFDKKNPESLGNKGKFYRLITSPLKIFMQQRQLIEWGEAVGLKGTLAITSEKEAFRTYK